MWWPAVTIALQEALQPLTPESSMSVSRPARRAVSVLSVSIALAACSGDLSAQSTRSLVSQTAPSAASANNSEATGTLRALPDFSPLVEKYGPAVVNVEVVEKSQPTAGGPPGLSPNDPFYDFFRRFGIQIGRASCRERV